MTNLRDEHASITVQGHARLHHRLKVWAVLGVLATGLVIGGIATWLLYQKQKEALSKELSYAVELHSQTLESELVRLVGIATQITSRTQIRKELEKYNRGKIDRQTLIDFTRPKLEDPMRLTQDIKGITRLDPAGDLLLEIGEPIEKSLWPSRISRESASLGIPGFVSGQYQLAISAPILNRNAALVGTDVVLFDHSRLYELMAEFYRKHANLLGIALLTIENSSIQAFLSMGVRPESILHRSDLSRALLGARKVGYSTVRNKNSKPILALYHSIGDSGWVFVLSGAEAALFQPAVELATYTAFAMLALILIGGSLTFALMRPLMRQLDDQTARLVILFENNRRLIDDMRSHEALVQSILDNTPAVIYIKDPAGRYQLVNGAYEKFSKLSRQHIIGKTDHQLFSAEIADRFRCNDLRVLDGGSAIEFDEQAPHEDGFHDYLSVKFPLLDSTGQVHAICGISTDISDRKAAERRLRQSAKVFESSGEGLVITNAEGTILDVNPAFTAIMGYEKTELLGKNPRLWKSDRHSREFFTQLWRSVREKGHWRGEIWNRRRDGSLIPELLTINQVLDEEGHVLSYVAVYSDISQFKQSQAKLEYLAHHDALTDLPNRVLFQARLEHGIERAERGGSNLAVVFLDLDQFKQINDSLGHNVGDQLLTLTATLLKQQLRKADTVARIGGDEFIFLLEDIFDSEDVIYTVEKILRAFDSEFLLAGHRLRITPSLGISIYPEDGRDAETLLRNADSAMYRAKAEGRNTYQFYTESLTIQALERLRLESGLRKAIENREFGLLYQPQIELVSGRIVGMEVLLRWHHPQEGIVLPDIFIPIAEDSGIIQALEDWVITSVCSQAKDWAGKGLDSGKIAVNISGKHIEQSRLSERLEHLLATFDLPAERIEIELTESFIMGRSGRSIDELMRLRNLGITLAVDDFGIGFSSLSYLKTLPINRIKIDKSFIRDIPGDHDDVAITQAIVALGTSLGLELVAEGVETSEQRDFLVGIGCTIGQGHLFFHPLSAEDMQKLLEQAASSAPP
ncbi:MAG: EAL domain-containing protein [Gammaproteobacteria bacterium]